MTCSVKNFARVKKLAACLLSVSLYACASSDTNLPLAENNAPNESAALNKGTAEKKLDENRLSKLLTESQLNQSDVSQRTIYGKVEHLADSTGLKYVGIKVNQADISVYLQQLKDILKEDFVEFRQHQAARDMNSFHVTLLSPNEFQFADKSKIPFGESLAVTLLGLGKVEQKGQTPAMKKATYFIVAQSSQAQFFRQKLTLNNKDFHVTLGFKPSDI